MENLTNPKMSSKLLFSAFWLCAFFLFIEFIVNAKGQTTTDESPKGRPLAPPGFVPKRPQIPEEITDSMKSKSEDISKGERHVPLEPAEAQKKFFGAKSASATNPAEVEKQIRDLEKLRALLAEYKQLQAAKAGKGQQPAQSEAFRQQQKLLAAEAKASEAKYGHGQRGGGIGQIGGGLQDYLLGDILLSVEQAEALVRSCSNFNESTVHAQPIRAKRSSLNFGNYPEQRWDSNQPIPYTFAADVGPTYKSLTLKALQMWSAYTCLNFAETTSSSQPIVVFQKGEPGSYCWAEFGKHYWASTQAINLEEESCQTIAVIAHELGHTLGRYHEQERHDRDTYVTVYMENTNLPSQYGRQTEEMNDNYQVKYDYGSLMHYPADSYNFNGQTVMVATEAHHQNTMGQQVRPAFSDLLMLNRAYNCLGGCASSGTQCQNGGFPMPKNCAKCVCPSGFGGDRCEARELSTPNAQCTGATLQATTDWQLLDGTVQGPGGTFSWSNSFEACHWHIRAPAGQRVSLWIEEVGLVGPCGVGCRFAHVEFKVAEFTRAGHRMCCQSDLGTEGYVQLDALGGLAVVSAYSSDGPKGFKLWYNAY